MKNTSYRIMIMAAVLFCMGNIFGVGKWIVYYQQNVAPYSLSELREKELAKVINVMVAKQPHAVVFREIHAAFPTEETWMHFFLGHPLGEALYKKYGTKAYSMCETFYNYGCYHGVITYMIREHGQDSQIVLKVKKACEDGVLGIVGCVHPIGHALGTTYSADIKRALQLCDVYYPYPDIVPECWIGAIMEHSNGLPQVFWVEHIDSFCQSFDAKYEPVCTRIVIRHIAREWNFDFHRLFERCMVYNRDEVRSACFNEVGYWIGQQYSNDIQHTIQICTEAVGYRDACLVGVARTFQTTDKKSTSRAICWEMHDSAVREDCLKIAD